MTLECQKADLYSDKMLFHLLLTLFYKLMRIGEMTILGSHDFAKKTHMAVIARYMLQNYTCASLAGLADQLNYSLSYCSHFVLENTGFTFKQLQKKIRMQKAVSYLLYADTPVNLIAEQLGYSCSENFMKVFKQEYGLTPTQYRARMKPQ
ncbi:MAG: AraC family transcriptional regulator [Firmicutes bacterium]|nr:AraC family transcriptional regulator [Bacillota bacterium]